MITSEESKFAKLLKEKKIIQSPRSTVILPPSAWAETWEDRPTESVAVGIRTISEEDVQIARAEAAKYSAQLHDDDDIRIDCYNDTLMRWAVARATTDPNNANEQYFKLGDVEVREALTSSGVRRLFDELDRLMVGESVVNAQITSDEVTELCSFLCGDALSKLSPSKGIHVRKMLAYCLEELRPDGKHKD